MSLLSGVDLLLSLEEVVTVIYKVCTDGSLRKVKERLSGDTDEERRRG